MRFAGGDDRVAWDKLGEDTASGLDTERERVDVDKKDTVRKTTLAGEDATLNCGAVRNCLVGVDRLGGLLAAEKFLNELLNLGNTR